MRACCRLRPLYQLGFDEDDDSDEDDDKWDEFLSGVILDDADDDDDKKQEQEQEQEQEKYMEF